MHSLRFEDLLRLLPLQPVWDLLGLHKIVRAARLGLAQTSQPIGFFGFFSWLFTAGRFPLPDHSRLFEGGLFGRRDVFRLHRLKSAELVFSFLLALRLSLAEPLKPAFAWRGQIVFGLHLRLKRIFLGLGANPRQPIRRFRRLLLFRRG